MAGPGERMMDGAGSPRRGDLDRRGSVVFGDVGAMMVADDPAAVAAMTMVRLNLPTSVQPPPR